MVTKTTFLYLVVQESQLVQAVHELHYSREVHQCLEVPVDLASLADHGDRYFQMLLSFQCYLVHLLNLAKERVLNFKIN